MWLLDQLTGKNKKQPAPQKKPLVDPVALQKAIQGAKYGVLANNPQAQKQFIQSVQPTKFNPVKAVPSVVNTNVQKVARAGNAFVAPVVNPVIKPLAATYDLSKAGIGQVTGNKVARNNALKQAGNDYKAVGQVVQDFYTKPAAEIGASVTKKGSYTPGSRVEKLIFGEGQIKGVPKIAGDTWNDSKGQNTGVRIAKTVGVTGAHIANDAPMVGGVFKGVTKGGKAAVKAAVLPKRPTKLTNQEVTDLANWQRIAGTGEAMGPDAEQIYARGVAAAQKAGIDYRRPDQIDQVLGAHRTHEVRLEERKAQLQALKGKVIPQPINNQIGAVGRNVLPETNRRDGVTFETVKPRSGNPKTIEVNKLYVDTTKQRQGTGKNLLAETFKNNPSLQAIEAYPGGKSEPFWLKMGTSEVLPDGTHRITRDSFEKATGISTQKKPLLKPLNQGGYVKNPLGKDAPKQNSKYGSLEDFKNNYSYDPINGLMKLKKSTDGMSEYWGKSREIQVPKGIYSTDGLYEHLTKTAPMGKEPKTPNQKPAPVANTDLSAQELTAGKLETPQNQSVPTSKSGSGIQKPVQAQEKVPQNSQTPIVQPLDKNRGFINTILEDPNTAPAVKNSIQSVYKVRNTAELQKKAATLAKEDPDTALRIVNADGVSDTAVAVAAELMKKAQKAGDFEQAISIAETIAPKLTEAGRAAQAASIYGKITPEGILRFTQKEINKFNKETGSNIKLDPAKAKALTERANKIQKMADGYEKQAEIAKLLGEIQKTMPATLAEKLSTLQTMAQLLNPKTNIRNILGNSIFSGLENISQTVATPVDKLLSAVRGSDRTTTLPNLKTQGKGLVSGGKKAVKEAYQGINTGPNTQFDLNSVPVMRGKVFGALEKTMNATLRGADRAAYEAAYDDTIRGLLKANKTDKVTPEMLEQAHYNGLYRTFQDTNAISDFFVGIKRSLNKIGIGTQDKRFGLGDLILKYPKTPANLLARGIDYSPAGFVKAIFEAGKPLAGKEFDQKAFVDAFSRAIVGSGAAFGTGYLLAQKGIITAQPEQNKDLRNLQKTQGQGGYQINASAMKRWIMSGFNDDAAKIRPGDTLVSYDWAQPVAIPVSAGAALGTEKPVKAGKEAANTVTNSANTLVEQPLLTGLQKFFGNSSTQGIGEAAAQVAAGTPASFVPTALNQVTQLFDNTARNTSGDGSITSQAINQVKAKIPGVSKGLPARIDVLGNPQERYQNGTNNPFNVALNPAFVNKYTPNNTAQTAIDLYNRTGETKQAPNTVPNKVTINGKDTKLTAEQQTSYQGYVGQQTANSYDQIVKNPKFTRLTDSQKINVLSSIQTDINQAAKIQLFGDQPDKVSTNVQNILNGNLSDVIDSKLKAQEPAVKKVKVSKLKTKSTGRKARGVKVAKAKLPRATKVKLAKTSKPKTSKVKLAITRKIGVGKVKKIRFNS